MNRAIVMMGLAVGLGVIGACAASRAEAANCGDTLGPGGTVTLTSDVGPCSTDPALTVIGPVTVDLAGHTVSCSNTGGHVGLAIIGRAAVVKNGRVTGCDVEGVDVMGDGGHRVTHFVAQDNTTGFVVASGRNTLNGNTAVSNAGNGFVISGTMNRVSDNAAADNVRDGFNVVAQENQTGFQVFSSRNTLDGNSAVSNGEGFLIDGDFNKLTNNIVTDSTNMGFDVLGGTHATFVGNAVFRSAGFGFFFSGGSSVLTGNTSVANPFGIYVAGTTNTLSLNTFVGNTTDAIDVATDCDKNKWLRNTIGVTFQTCIH